MIRVPVADFSGGLNLRDASGVLDPKFAIDALNVEFGSRGAIVQRPGFDAFTSGAAAARYDCLHPYYESDGTKQLLAGRGSTVEAINTSGGSVSTQGSLSASPHYFARFATPGSELCYIGNGTDKIFKWDGASFTAPASMGTVPKGKFLAVQPWDNRLVTAGFSTTTGGPSGADTNPSTVWWSDAGDPETWSADNYIHLTPGDGESIMGVVSWRDSVFVFKESKFFVFYGTSTLGTGTPEFQYREVKGAGLASSRALVAARDGVYFLSRNGIYRTTGGEPVQVSDNIDALFGGDLSDFYTGSQVNQSQITLAAAGYFNERVYFAVPTGSSTYNDRMLVHDPRFGWWSVYDIPAAAIASWRPSNADELMFAYATGDNHLGRHSNSYTSDDGTAITARCRGGWFAPAEGECSLRQVRAYGIGNVTISVAVDFAGTTGTGVTHDLTEDTVTYGDGGITYGDETYTWGEGQTFTDALYRGFGAFGHHFSITYSNNVLDSLMRVEKIRLDFQGDRRR